jgi:predicted dehydrogenase
MKVGLIGAGGISQVHCAGYQNLPNVQVCAVADLIIERAETRAQLFGARAYPSLQAMLAAEKLDAVDICVPSYLHAEMAVECLDAGLHVLCEKPLAFDRAGADAVLAAWKRSGKMFMVAQVLRFWPEYQYFKQLIAEGTYGPLRQASFTRTSGAPAWGGWYTDPARSGMAPFELHIHDLDFIHFLLGKPLEIQSYGWREDTLLASYLRTRLVYPGVIVDAEAGWYRAPLPFAADYRAVFEGAVLDYRGGELYLAEAGASERRKIQVESGPDSGPLINLPGTFPYYNEIAYFTGCVINRKAPETVTPYDSRESIEMLFQAVEAAEGRTF